VLEEPLAQQLLALEREVQQLELVQEQPLELVQERQSRHRNREQP
jgi:hypothetical protein